MNDKLFFEEKNTIGNVVRILNNKELVINIGLNDGLKLKDKIIIYEVGEVVKDQNDKIIGTLDHIKAELIVTKLYDNMAVCEYPKKTVSAFEKSVASISNSFISYEEESLKVDEKEIEPYKKIHSNIIHLGDNVKKKLTND